MGPFYGWGSTASRLQSHNEEAVYFLLLSSQVLFWLTSDIWKAESTLGVNAKIAKYVCFIVFCIEFTKMGVYNF